MVKKSLVAVVLASALLAVPTVGFADATQLSVTSDSTTNKSTETNVTTKGSVSFTGGNLTLSGLKDPEPFAGGSVSDAYAGNFSQDTAMTPLTVLDNLGDGGTWTLTAEAAGWEVASTDASPKGADALNTGKLSISGVMVKGKDAAETSMDLAAKTPVTIATGTEDNNGPENVKSGKYTLALTQGTNMRKGTYTNTITWTLANEPGKN